MKKKLILIFLFSVFLLVGCGKNNESVVMKKMDKKINNIDSYHLVGVLDITNNDESYTYDVDVAYKKENNYRVNLINKSNSHEQIILKNKDAVYVVTPSLNKSFKFQSDWPNNNSQIYLLQSIMQDIKNDKERVFEEKNGEYIFTTSVKYPNNKKLVKQNIKVGSDYLVKEIEVLDGDNVPQMIMKFKEIDLNTTFDDNYFELDSMTDTKNDEEKSTENKDVENKDTENKNTENKNSNSEGSDSNVEKKNKDDDSQSSTKSSSLDDVIFPLYVPVGTTLANQEKISKTDGERVILTFDGEKPFLLVEETSAPKNDFSILPTYGEPFLMAESVAALTNNSLMWNSNGVEYYLVSDVLSQPELIEIANSISTIPTMK